MYGGVVIQGRRAGSGVDKNFCREPKKGQQKVQLYYENDPLSPSRNIIYLGFLCTSDPVKVLMYFLFALIASLFFLHLFHGIPFCLKEANK